MNDSYVMYVVHDCTVYFYLDSPEVAVCEIKYKRQADYDRRFKFKVGEE